MRWPLGFIMIFAIQLHAETQDSTPFASAPTPPPQLVWLHSREGLSDLSVQEKEARIKAFVRDLLGDEGGEVPALAELHSASPASTSIMPPTVIETSR